MTKLSVKIAVNNSDVKAATDLLNCVYQNKGYMVDNLKSQLNVTTFVVKDLENHGKVIATATVRTPFNTFETDKLFGLTNDMLVSCNINRSKTVELGRFANISSVTSKNDYTFFVLNYSIMVWMRKNLFTGWLAILKPNLSKSLQKFGYELQDISSKLNISAGNYDRFKKYFEVDGTPSVYYSELSGNRDILRRYKTLANRWIHNLEI